MNTTVENELVTGMREHVAGMALDRDIVAAAAVRVRRRQRLGRTASVAGTFVLATAVASAAGIGPLGAIVRPDGAGPPVATASGGPASAVGSGVETVLLRAALVAEHETSPQPGQYLFLHQVSSVVGGRTPGALDQKQETRIWLSLDGRHPGKIQVRPYGGDGPWTDRATEGDPCAGSGQPVGTEPCGIPALVSGLPTGEDAMLTWLYDHGSDVGLRDESGNPVGPTASRDTRAWNAALDLLHGYLPPSSQAALLRSLARLPGTQQVPTVTDAAGRTVTGVSRSMDGIVSVLLFDPETGEFCGVLQQYATDSALGQAGDPVSSEATLQRDVVSGPGQLP